MTNVVYLSVSGSGVASPMGTPGQTGRGDENVDRL